MKKFSPKKSFLYFLTLLFLSFPFYAFGEEPTVTLVDPNARESLQIITLKDGSQIKGRLIGIHGGMYSFKTTTMGTVNVQISNVVTIANQQYVSSPVSSTSAQIAPAMVGNVPVSNLGNPKVAEIQKQLISDPAMLSDIQSMAKDPEIMQLLSDPKFASALVNQDMESLKNDPKTQQLLNNPKMQQLMGEVLQKAGSILNQP